MHIQSTFREIQKINKEIDIESSCRIYSILLFPIIIGIFLFINYTNKLRELEKRKQELLLELAKSANEQISYAQSIIDEIQRNDTYLIYSKLSEANSKLDTSLKIIDEISQLPKNTITGLPEIKQKIVDVKEQVNNFNELFVARRKKDYDYLFKKSTYPLDDDQKSAVIIDDKHNLVVAGAGSGKTEVLINRIAYLIEREPDSIKPDRILALAFQNKAANEIRDRLKERFGFDVKIKTFHALGKEIIGKAYDNPPRIKFSGDNFDIQFNEFIEKLYDGAKDLPEFQDALLDYMTYFNDEDRSEEEFNNKFEYYQYLNQLTYTALNGVKVKSDAERTILNFFLTHTLNDKKIKIDYEKPAVWMSYKNEKGVYRMPVPDFFFPEFNIYLEHWALDENGNVPPWFTGERVNERYKKGMAVKKKCFLNQDKYRLIETYSYEFKNKNIDDIIASRFVKTLIDFNPDRKYKISARTVEELVKDSWCYKESINSLPGNIARFITIAKTYNLKPEDIEKRLTEEPWTYKQRAFGKLALIIYKEYENNLRLDNEIDFADMINLAVKELKTNPHLYENTFDHILIDEYQDISTQRFHLIKELINKNKDCKLFCVGDDWQSIYGFTGANVDYFVMFENYFDHPQRTDLTINYRSTKPIVDTGAAIIKCNGNVQLSKTTQASKQYGTAVNVYLLSTLKDAYYTQMVHHCVDSIKKLLESGYKPNDIMILSRIVKNPRISTELVRYSKSQNVPISTENRSNNHVPFMSVHKSKGLQARVIFILNVIDDMYGFPCKIEDPKIFELAIIGRKKDRQEEERRLFYVAVTRAMEAVIIYSQKNQKSKFIEEISNKLTINNL